MTPDTTRGAYHALLGLFALPVLGLVVALIGLLVSCIRRNK